MIAILFEVCGTVTKSLEKGLEEWKIIETIATTALAILATILRRALENRGDLQNCVLVRKIILV